MLFRSNYFASVPVKSRLSPKMSPKPQGTSRLFCINQTQLIRAGDTKFRAFSSFSSLWPGGCFIKSQTVKKGEYAALSPHTERNMKHESKPIRWDVFIPCFVVIGGAALLGKDLLLFSKLSLHLIVSFVCRSFWI